MGFDVGDWVMVTGGEEAGRVGSVGRIAGQQAVIANGVLSGHTRSYTVDLRLSGARRRTVTIDESKIRPATAQEIDAAEHA